MTDDTIIEGEALKQPVGIGNGGYEEQEYRFEIGRRAEIDDIHSATISIDGQRYVLCPF